MNKKPLYVIATIALLGLILSFGNQELFARGGGGRGGGGERRGGEGGRGEAGRGADDLGRRGALQRTPALSRGEMGFAAGAAAGSRNEGSGGGGGGGTGVNIIQEPPQQNSGSNN